MDAIQVAIQLFRDPYCELPHRADPVMIVYTSDVTASIMGGGNMPPRVPFQPADIQHPLQDVVKGSGPKTPPGGHHYAIRRALTDAFRFLFHVVFNTNTGVTMTYRIRQWVLPVLVSLVVLVGLSAGVAANSGAGLPGWGGSGTDAPKAGPLGLNTTTTPAEGDVPVAINIPDAEVDAEVEIQQIVDGQMLDPSGPWVVSWYEQTAMAGTTGNSVMSGHVDYWEVGPAVFRNVANLQPGAEIRVIGQDGATYVYALEYIERVYIADLTAEQVNSPRLVGNTDYAALTLITCGGEFDREAGEYLSRDIIRARLVSSDSGNAQAAAPTEEPAAAGEGQATVNDSDVNLRSEASTSGDIVATLSNGDVVTVLGDSEEADDFVWVPVRLEDGTEGWVVEDYLDLPE